jgi:peptidoglycan/LPS O-acetylase OafA/YrhL
MCVWILAVLPVPKGQLAGLHNPWGIVTNNYLLAASIALFFYGLLTETTILKKILSNKFIELLGKSSYIFYLIHLGYIADFLHYSFNRLNDYFFVLYDNWGVDWYSPFEYDNLNVLYAFVILNGISIMLFKLIEDPLNYYIRKSNLLIRNDRTKTVASAATVK